MDSSSTNNNLMEHKFVSGLIEDIFYFYSNHKTGSPGYRYCKNVQHQFSKTKHILDTLQLIRVLVAERHEAINTGNTTINKETILTYHLDNYFGCLSRFQAEIILLITTVYEWHLPKGAGNEALLKRAQENAVTAIPGIIQTIETLIFEANPLKSNITDKTGMSNADIALIESVKEAENLLKQTLGGKDDYEEDKTEYYNTIVADNLNEMTAIEEKITVLMQSVLDFLYPTYAANSPGTDK